MTTTTNNAYVRVNNGGSLTEYHPGCAVAYADSRGVHAGSLSETATVEDVVQWLATDPTLPVGVSVSIVRPLGEALGTCGQCRGSLRSETEGQPEEGTEEESTAWAYVTTGGRRYTVQEALNFAARQGVRKPDDMTLEQAVDFVRRNHLDYSDLTLISEDEETQYPAADSLAGVAYPTEPEAEPIELGEVEDFTLTEDEDQDFEDDEEEETEDDGGFGQFMASLTEAVSSQEALAQSFRSAVASATVHALQQQDAAEDEAFAKGAAHVAARVLGIDTEAYDWQTFVTTVAAITPQQT